MIRAVIDTDIASYIFKSLPPSRYYRQALAPWNPVLSFMSIAEMRAGALMADWRPRRQSGLEKFLRDFDVVYPDDGMCALWAELRSAASRRGRHLSVQDAWIAATALALDAPLATNNRRDYEHIPDLELLAL